MGATVSKSRCPGRRSRLGAISSAIRCRCDERIEKVPRSLRVNAEIRSGGFQTRRDHAPDRAKGHWVELHHQPCTDHRSSGLDPIDPPRDTR